MIVVHLPARAVVFLEVVVLDLREEASLEAVAQDQVEDVLDS
jgi:hypothetical protein